MTDLTLSGLLTSFVDAHGITAFREPNVASNLLSDVLGDLSDLEPAKRQALVASVRDRTLARLLDRSPRTVDGWAADRATMAKPEWLYEAWAAPCDREVFPVEALADAGFGTFAVDVCRRLGLQPVRPMPTQRPIEAVLALAADGAVLRVAGIRSSPQAGGNGSGVTPTPVATTSPTAPYSTLVSPAASGETLGDRVASLGPASGGAGASVMRSLAAALVDLHRQGITHGLIGPENVLFDTWQTVVLADVGLAGLNGRAPTVETDLRSLATLAFYVFSGAAPPAGTHRNSVAPLADVAPQAPVALAELVDRTLTPDPHGVKPTALDFYRALEPTVAETSPAPAAPLSAADPAISHAPTAPPPTPPPAPPSAASPGASPPRRRSKGLLVGALVGLVAVGAGVAFAVKSNNNDTKPTSTTLATAATATATAATAGTTATGAAPDSTSPVAVDSAPTPPPASEATTTASATNTRLTSVDGMVPIDAGTYTVGSDKGGIKILESSLARSVTLSKFFIDSTEVTNEQYSRWLQTRPNGVPTPNSWGDDNSLDAGTEKRPVQGVAYEHAEAYCNALGKRLPLEAEWEVAASGAPQPFKSPTDDDTTYDVGSQPGNVSAVGAFDMVGNSWEYVAASYEDAIREDPTLAVVRGGSNNFTLDPTKREAGSPTDFYMAKWAGFRCAVSADAPAPTTDFKTVTIKATPPALEHPKIASDELDYDFKDPRFRTWPGKKTATSVSGYHPLDSFHLQVKGDSVDLVSVAPVANLDYLKFDYAVIATGAIFADKTISGDGYCFGVGAGIDQSQQGIFLTVCPTLSPGDATANIFVRKADGTTVPLYPNLSLNVSQDQTVTLQINVKGADSFEFLVDGQTVSPVVDGQLQAILGLAGGRGVGLYLKSAPGDSQVHVHFHHFTLSKTPKA